MIEQVMLAWYNHAAASHHVQQTRVDLPDDGAEFSWWCHDCKRLCSSVAISWDNERKSVAVQVLL